MATLALGPEWLQPDSIIGRMEARRYLTYSLVGGVAWAAGVTALGFRLDRFAVVRDDIEMMLILIVVLPIVVELVRARRKAEVHVA